MQYESCYGNTGEAPNLNIKVKKMADSRFALSNQNIVEQLKENAKNKNTSKAAQTWLNVWQTWATERKLNPRLEEYKHEQLDKMLQIFYTEIRTKDGLEYEPESLNSMRIPCDGELNSLLRKPFLAPTPFRSFLARGWTLMNHAYKRVL